MQHAVFAMSQHGLLVLVMRRKSGVHSQDRRRHMIIIPPMIYLPPKDPFTFIIMPRHTLLSTPMIPSSRSSYPSLLPPHVVTTPTSTRIEPHALCCTCRPNSATSHPTRLTRYTGSSEHGRCLHNSCTAQSACRQWPELSSSPSTPCVYFMACPD